MLINRTSSRFLLGFIVILFVSLIVIFAAGYFDEKGRGEQAEDCRGELC